MNRNSTGSEVAAVRIRAYCDPVFGKLRARLTYANVVATLALFVALGGSSYAVTALSKNSVRSKHIVNGQVKRADIGRNAVTSPKVKDFSLLASDFAAGQLPRGEKGDKGDRGLQGVRGIQGEPGTDGAPGSARAYALGGGLACPGAPVIACPVLRGKGAAGAPYIFKVATGVYCVGFPGIDAAASGSVALVGVSSGGSSGLLSARWARQNSACISYEFEVETRSVGSTGVRNSADNGTEVVGSAPAPSDSISFTIAIL
jgi:hypothetical protein